MRYTEASCLLRLTQYAPWPENPEAQMAPRYRAAPKSYQVIVETSAMLPVGSIVLEGSTFPCPSQNEEFLTTMYGYLGKGARYCSETGFYLAPLEPTTP